MARRPTHGMDGTKIYHLYYGIIKRCYNKNAANYHMYGGRGIGVCDEWRFGCDDKTGFECFYRDMGERPDGMSLDRIDNLSDYSPSNCCWATFKKQANNRRDNKILTLNGISHTQSEWSDITGIKSYTISYRLKKGWSIEQALTIKPNRRNRV